MPAAPPHPSSGTAPRSLAIAVLTYRRPDDLAALLPLLHDQLGRCGLSGTGVGARAGAGRPPAEPAGEILVVDNDPDGSGAAVCARAGIPRLRYVHEPVPGIAAARNRALDEADGHDLLVFVDDDERPVPRWLERLLGTFETADRVGVVGPVVSEFAVPLPPWVAAGRFFDRRRMPTGSPVTVAATNNLLIDLHRLRRSRVRFDDRFGLSGGSDTLFTRQLVQREGPLVWCDEAVVTDVVPVERCTRDWVLRRALRMGNSWSLTTVALRPAGPRRWLTRLGLTGSGGARVLGGLARWMLGAAGRDRGRRARGIRTLARGTGMVLGAYGYSYVEYRRRRPLP